jgi:hypothetical protein
MRTGFVEALIASSEVLSPECETSTAIPIRFMRATAVTPYSVNPLSRTTPQPAPSVFSEL